MSYLLYFVLCRFLSSLVPFFFFFNDTATTEIYTLSLHDALPISRRRPRLRVRPRPLDLERELADQLTRAGRSEEHTSELQSRLHLVCRLLLEKKKKKQDVNSKRHNTCEYARNHGPPWTARTHNQA